MLFNFFIQPRFHRDFNRNHDVRIVMGVYVFSIVMATKLRFNHENGHLDSHRVIT